MAVVTIEKPSDTVLGIQDPLVFVLDPHLQESLAGGAKRTVDAMIRVRFADPDHGGMRVNLVVPSNANARTGFLAPALRCINRSEGSVLHMERVNRPSFFLPPPDGDFGLVDYVVIPAGALEAVVSLRASVNLASPGGIVGVHYTQDVAHPTGFTVLADSVLSLNS